MKELDFSEKYKPFGDEVAPEVQRAIDFLLELHYEVDGLSDDELVGLADKVALERADELSDYELDLLFDDAD